MKTRNEPIKRGWSYTHSFGVISAENENVELVVTEHEYWNGERWGYNYYRLGTYFVYADDGIQFAKNLNLENYFVNVGETGEQLFFDANDSQDFLLTLQDIFPKAEIRA